MKLSFYLVAEANTNVYSPADQTAGRGAQQTQPSDEELQEIQDRIEQAKKEKEAEEKAEKEKKDEKSKKESDDEGSEEDSGEGDDQDSDSDSGDSDDDDSDGDSDSDDESGDVSEEDGDDSSEDAEDDEGEVEEEEESDEEATASSRKIGRGDNQYFLTDGDSPFFQQERNHRIHRNVSESAAFSGDIKVVSGFPGVGKSTLTEKYPDTVRDSDSSKFDKALFPGNYMAHINELRADDSVDLILVSSHFEVRDTMEEYAIPFILVYPDSMLLEEYVERYRERGSSEQFIETLKDNWDAWLNSCKQQDGCIHIVLQPGQYLSDVLVP